MSSPVSHLSDSNLRRYGKATRKKSVALYSDYYEEKEKNNKSALSVAQRSVSLTALHPGPAPLEPRMAQLETLEAKMASIEVSLSSTTTTPRRKKVAGQPLQRASRDTARELETLRNALRDKENVIQTLKGQLSSSPGLGGRGGGAFLTAPIVGEVERRAARDRLNRLRQDMDNKRLAIKNLALALERLDVSDNIDVRIQQAELEFQLGREELNLLGLLEEARGLQTLLEDAAPRDSASLFSCVGGAGHVTLHAVALHYDAKSPRFGAGQQQQGLLVEWAAADSGLLKGDRLVEVNGKLVLSAKSPEELVRLLAVSPSPAQLVVLRARSQCEWQRLRDRAEEAERDNVRLSHRISYLEDQVAELQGAAAQQGGGRERPQLFQKGPQVTALVPQKPHRSKHHNRDAGYVSEGVRHHQRPTPPKKPLRLSLHRATSLQTVNVAVQQQQQLPPPAVAASAEEQSRKAAAKRNHKGEATPTGRWPSPGRKWY